MEREAVEPQPRRTVREILLERVHFPASLRVEEEIMTDETQNMSSDREMLARIDERTKSLSTTVEQKDMFIRQEMDKIARAIAAMPGEIDAKLKSYATTEALHAVSKRLEGVEGVNKTIGLAVILAFLTAVGGLVFRGGG